MAQKKPKPFKVALIGCGKMGNIHRRAISELASGASESYYKGDVDKIFRRLRLSAVVDPAFTGMKKHEGVACYADHHRLLQKEIPDAAVLASPTETHHAIASDLLAAGIPLLIEKPVCATTKDIIDLKNLAEKKAGFIFPGHVERYNPVVLDIREILQHRLYGKTLSYEFIRISPRPDRIPDSLIVDKLVHDLDLLLLFFGNPTLDVAEFSRDEQGVVVEADIRFRHRNGMTGRIFSSWRTEKKERRISLNAERADVEADLLAKSLFVNRHHEFSKRITGYENNQAKDQFADFIAGAEKLFTPLVTIADALRCGRIIDRLNRLASESS